MLVVSLCSTQKKNRVSEMLMDACCYTTKVCNCDLAPEHALRNRVFLGTSPSGYDTISSLAGTVWLLGPPWPVVWTSEVGVTKY